MNKVKIKKEPFHGTLLNTYIFFLVYFLFQISKGWFILNFHA